jgi:RNA polymerase sigma factor (sigma-70 family)
MTPHSLWFTAQGDWYSQLEYSLVSTMGPNPGEQASLAERIRTGDAPAEGAFVLAFRQKVFIMLLARIRNAEDAREITQDVMFSVLRALRDGRVREIEKLSAFVHGTARNLANNYLRCHNQRPADVPITPDMLLVDPVNQTEISDRLRLVHQALQRLDLVDRRILTMTLLEGLKPGEIAGKLSLNPELVRQRKSRALKQVIAQVRKMSRK